MSFNWTNDGKLRLFPKEGSRKSCQYILCRQQRKNYLFLFRAQFKWYSNVWKMQFHQAQWSWNEITCRPIWCGLSGINQYVTYRINQSPCPSSVRVLQTNNDWGQVYFPLLPPSFLRQSSSPLGSLLTHSSPLVLPRPRWQQQRIIHSCSKNTPALQANHGVDFDWGY